MNPDFFYKMNKMKFRKSENSRQMFHSVPLAKFLDCRLDLTTSWNNYPLLSDIIYESSIGGHFRDISFVGLILLNVSKKYRDFNIFMEGSIPFFIDDEFVYYSWFNS